MTANQPRSEVRNVVAIDLEPPPPIGDRWAVIVGISRYKHGIRDLEWAAQDAVDFRELLRLPSAGGYKDDRVLRLLDEQATTVAVNSALRSFLKRPGPNDLVILYFACHGFADPDRSNVVYFVTHDTDPANIPSTAVPMRDIQLVLKDILLARNVVILADTCHSAALVPTDGLRSAIRDAQVINRYLADISTARPGVALLTSAALTEPAREGPWGGGHGVFTHFLLDGLRGAADGYKGHKDGKVSLGELFDYVSDKVREATDNKQHPVGNADHHRDLPMAHVGQLRAPEYYEAGIGMLRLAMLGRERTAFLSADRHLRESIEMTRASGDSDPRAQLARARALMGAGLSDQVCALLACLEATQLRSDAQWLLGCVCAGDGDWPRAIAAFSAFAAEARSDPRCSFAHAFAASRPPRLIAIVIAVDSNAYLDDERPWCRNDVARIEELLRAAGFEITRLQGASATADAVRRTITDLQDPNQPDPLQPIDQVVIFYSGSNFTDKDGIEDPYLKFHDFRMLDEAVDRSTIPGGESGRYQGTFSAGDILTLLSVLRARVLLIIDGECNRALLDKVRDNPIFDLMFATSPGQRAWFIPGAEPTGRFTHALCEAARDRGRTVADLTYGEWLGTARRIMKNQPVEAPQVPLVIGDHMARLHRGDELCNLLRYIEGEQTSGVSSGVLQRRYDTVCNSYMDLYGDGHLRFAHDFFERGLYEAAGEAFTRAIARGNQQGWLGLAAVQAVQNPAGAFDALQEGNKSIPEADVPRTSALVEAVTVAVGPGARRAVLVAGLVRSGMAARASEALELVHRFLRERLALHPDDIVRLQDATATVDHVMTTVQGLVSASPGLPVLFYYHGDIAVPGDALVLRGARDDMPGFLALEQLAETCKKASQWLTILDADHVYVERPIEGRERVPRTSPIGLREIGEDLDAVPRSMAAFPIGRATLAPEGYQGIGSRLTSLSSLSSWDSWREALEPVRLHGTMPSGPVLKDVAGVLAAVRRYQTRWLVELRQLLERSLEEREKTESWPEGHADLAEVLLAAGEYSDAAKEYQIVLSAFPGHPASPSIQAAIQRAHRGLGRALLESGSDYSGAVHMLKNAVHAKREDAQAHYYLSRAIRMVIERETLEEAAKALETYRDLGGPLGHLSDPPG